MPPDKITERDPNEQISPCKAQGPQQVPPRSHNTTASKLGNKNMSNYGVNRSLPSIISLNSRAFSHHSGTWRTYTQAMHAISYPYLS
ncbi:hypothetical protein HBI65_219110 [Parastagonospora nodorum]|nr:hypothetical protein HBI21_223430 [Parastagonospora nodorum]KAH6079558.1 hypothetical protein HBI65_219110 [Parastagonospora nodorum]